MSPGELVTVTAKRLRVPRSTVLMYDRDLFAAGLRTKGGRGTSAARVTTLDGARLLIALLATERPSDAADAALTFGDLRTHPDIVRSGDRSAATWLPSEEVLPLDPTHRFEDALVYLLENIGSDAFQTRIDPRIRTNGKRRALPEMVVRVIPNMLRAEIQLGVWTFAYMHEGLHARGSKIWHGDPGEGAALLQNYFNQARKYFRGLRTTRHVETSEVLDLATFIKADDDELKTLHAHHMPFFGEDA